MGVVPAAIVILPSLPIPRSKRLSSTHPVWQGDSHKLRVGPLLYPIDENLHTHTHKHTHTQMRVGTRFGAYRWNMEISPFIWSTFAFFISRERRKRYKRVVPNYFICHTHCHCQRDCNLAKIMLANKNGKRHKRPHSLSPSLSLSLSLYICI